MPYFDNETLIAKAAGAFRKAAAKIVREAKIHGVPVIVWEAGRIRAIPGEDLDEGDFEACGASAIEVREAGRPGEDDFDESQRGKSSSGRHDDSPPEVFPTEEMGIVE